MKSVRKDHLELKERGEVSETEAARQLQVTTSTLSKWRRNGFKAQGFALTWRHAHKRLVAYTVESINAFLEFRASAAPA